MNAFAKGVLSLPPDAASEHPVERGFSSITGGLQNQVFSQYTSVVGGLGNNVCAGNYSSILGGKNNVVNGAYSSILGGSGNNIAAAYSYAGVFGCNINAVCGCMFHVNSLWASAIPAWSATLVPGTIYCGTPPPGAIPLWIA